MTGRETVGSVKSCSYSFAFLSYIVQQIVCFMCHTSVFPPLVYNNNLWSQLQYVKGEIRPWSNTAMMSAAGYCCVHVNFLLHFTLYTSSQHRFLKGLILHPGFLLNNRNVFVAECLFFPTLCSSPYNKTVLWGSENVKSMIILAFPCVYILFSSSVVSWHSGLCNNVPHDYGRGASLLIVFQRKLYNY